MHTRDAHTRKRHSHLYLGNFASNHGKRLISSILHRLQRSARQPRQPSFSTNHAKPTFSAFGIDKGKKSSNIGAYVVASDGYTLREDTRKHISYVNTIQARRRRRTHPGITCTSCTTSPPRTISAVSHRTMGTVFGEQSNPTITCRVVPDCNRRLHSHASPHAHPSPHAPSHEHRAHGHVARAPSAAEHSIVVLFVIARRVPFNAQASRAGVAE